MASVAMQHEIPVRPVLDARHWFAVSTHPRHEKRVLQHLQERRIEAFLPLYGAVHAWKDRKQLVHLPLFPGYMFVRIRMDERLNVLKVPSIARFLCFEGRPAPLPEAQIECIRKGCERGAHFEPHPFLKSGAPVRVKHGCLAGAEGIIVRRKHSLRFVVSLELLHRAVSVEVDATDIEPLR